mmetsp:Transcript_9205/g.28239  ORF Transcript_9205/g.28239 Transcript_9205/m.28239 type:complete len:265 (-) Transcript_9205:202-996(-)
MWVRALSGGAHAGPPQARRARCGSRDGALRRVLLAVFAALPPRRVSLGPHNRHRKRHSSGGRRAALPRNGGVLHRSFGVLRLPGGPVLPDPVVRRRRSLRVRQLRRALRPRTRLSGHRRRRASLVGLGEPLLEPPPLPAPAPRRPPRPRRQALPVPPALPRRAHSARRLRHHDPLRLRSPPLALRHPPPPPRTPQKTPPPRPRHPLPPRTSSRQEAALTSLRSCLLCTKKTRLPVFSRRSRPRGVTLHSSPASGIHGHSRRCRP